MVITGDSYTVEERRISASETVSTLVIKRVARHKQQMGRYTCVASNSLGADEKDVNIYRKFARKFVRWSYGLSKMTNFVKLFSNFQLILRPLRPQLKSHPLPLRQQL